jgi:ATP-dependent DNA helicase RecQ
VLRQGLILGFLQKDIENYGLLSVTHEGRNFLAKPHSVMIAKDHDYTGVDADDASIVLNEGKGAGVDENLFTMLRDLRKELAIRNNVPPYIVFQDPSLEDMTIQYPITMEEMNQISGVGAGKASRYGQEFIDLIKTYVEENEIERPGDLVVKSIVNKSGLKVFIIQNIDRKLPLDEIASAKGLKMEELIKEIEHIVNSGTSVNIDYHVNSHVDADHLEEIIMYFKEEESDSIQVALEELGEDEYSEQEIRLVRIKFISQFGN